MAVSPRPSAIPRTAAPGRILLVDDDKNILTAYARILAKEGHTVVSAGAATEALARFAEGTFDAVLSDVMMPGLNGLALLAALRERAPLVPVIFITAAPTIDTAAQAVAGGAHLYLMKPIEAVKLREVVADAVWKGQVARRERDALETAERAERAARAQDAGLEGAFQRALETMTIAYQPIVSWPTRTTLAYEALMRSKEPLLPHPGAVLDAAERLGRLGDLCRVILGRTALPIAQMGPDALLFVNLHSSDLVMDWLYGAGNPLLANASRVVFEVTERAALDTVPDVKERVRKLREMGFRIALDDIGAGYSGLTSFALLEPEVVKIDMALVRDVDREPTKQKLVRSMAGLCRDMGLTVVAEGVETVAERDTLAGLGIDVFQGYLFARPGAPFPAVSWNAG